MKISKIIEKLQQIKDEIGFDIEVIIIKENYIDKDINFDLGVIGNKGEFVDEKEVEKRKWDSIIDIVAIS